MKSFITLLCVWMPPALFAQAPAILPDELAPGTPKTAMMNAWLTEQSMAALDRRDAAFEALETDEDLATWQRERHEFFLRQIGGLPEKTPLNARVTGELVFDDYRIEKVIFESQPGLHVTAVLYLPKGQGPFPAVLHPTGHSARAKNRELYQQASIVIAKGGCAVLNYDPIGQGERQQVYQDDGKEYASTIQHTLINQGAHLLGTNTARFMIWDGMRAIDYLQSRPDIDGDKIGCTGISGGGTNTSYLMVLDDRITAAAPGCYLTGFRSLLNTIGPQDAEQNIHGQIAFGMDHADYVLMRLPKPTLIMAATHDYFDIEGAWQLFRQGKRFATRLGYPERVDLVETDTDHGFPTGMRVGAANWMRRWLLDLNDPITEGELHPLPEEELNVLATGKVLDLENARTAFDLNAELCASFAERRAENAKPENHEALRETIRRLIGARALGDLPDPRIEEAGVGFVIEPETGIQLPVRVAENPSGEKFALFLPGNGVQAAIDSGEAAHVAEITEAAVLATDLRGLGETENAGGRKGFDEFFGPDWKDTNQASLLGKSYVGMRVEDIWQIVRAWREQSGRHDLKPILVATGEAAIPALHAAALAPDLFAEVRIYRSIRSWTEVVESPVVRNQQPNLVFGALREYDLPALRAMLGDRLTFEDPVSPADSAEISAPP